jgi:GT2 family glycosyltransferase
MTFHILVVLYKRLPEDSESLQSLATCLRRESASFTVWDNSPDAAPDASLDWLSTRFVSVEYRHTPENVSLSKIYNQIIRQHVINSENRPEYLVLLDQDTIVESDYLNSAFRAGAENPDINLLLPIVEGNGVIVSPANLYYGIGRRWIRVLTGRIRSHFRTAINSGMVIRASYLLKQFDGYDERLRFYGTDNDFMQKYAATNRELFVFDSRLRHDLASFSVEDVEAKLWRHRENVRALLLSNGRGIGKALIHLYAFVYSARLAYRFRDRRFLSC